MKAACALNPPRKFAGRYGHIDEQMLNDDFDYDKNYKLPSKHSLALKDTDQSIATGSNMRRFQMQTSPLLAPCLDRQFYKEEISAHEVVEAGDLEVPTLLCKCEKNEWSFAQIDQMNHKNLQSVFTGIQRKLCRNLHQKAIFD